MLGTVFTEGLSGQVPAYQDVDEWAVHAADRWVVPLAS